MIARLPQPIRQIILLIRDAATEWQKDNAARLAAALAYHTAFSLAPLLVIVFAVAGTFWSSEAVHVHFLGEIERLIGKDGAAFIADIVVSAGQGDKNIVAMLIGLATLLVGSTGAFTHLRLALNEIWDVPEENIGSGFGALARSRILAFGMLLTVGFLLLVSLILSAAITAMDGFMRTLLPSIQFLIWMVNFIVSIGLITVLFALIYKFLPDAEIKWPDVWIGAAMTASLFSIGKFLIGLYLGNSSITSTYGAAASFAIILVWIYYSAQIFFFGAELTQVYANRFGSRFGAQTARRLEAEIAQAENETLAEGKRYEIDNDTASMSTEPEGEYASAKRNVAKTSSCDTGKRDTAFVTYPAVRQEHNGSPVGLPKLVRIGGLLVAVGLTIRYWLRQ